MTGRSAATERASRVAAILLGVAILGLTSASGALRVEAKRAATVVETEDGQYVHLHLEGDPTAQAWLYRPMLTDDEDEEESATDEEAPPPPADLIVALHGAGGIPKEFVLPVVMEERGAWCLTVAGRTSVRSARGEGFLWRGDEISYITAFTEYLLEKYALRRDRVIVWGHSAGGTMALRTLAAAPKLFAGGLTTAASATPDARHGAMRTCVFLGTDDPNWRGARAVSRFVARLAKKNGPGACAFFALEGLGHELPYDEYLDLGFSWILHGNARGGEATGGRRPRGHEGAWHHILVRYRGAGGREGSDDVKRSKRAATQRLESIRDEVEKGRAYFPFEAACHSEDEKTASGGGALDEDALRAFLPELPSLRSGEVSGILPSAAGLHLVYHP